LANNSHTHSLPGSGGTKDRKARVLHAISPRSAAIIYEYEINNGAYA